MKAIAFRAVAILIGLLVATAIAELVLRAAGFRPWTYTGQDANEPTMHEPDATLGWRAKKGSYTVPPYHASGAPIQLTFLENGRRRAGPDAPAGFDMDVLLVGDSFTQGWAVSDSETYAWKLQTRFPRYQVLNYGTAGYGTYQSLLVLERELPRLRRPAVVLYGFNEFHEPRNVAAGAWLRSLAQYAKRSQVDVPFATLGEGQQLIRHPPQRYVSLPYRESSALVALLEQNYMTARTKGRVSQRRAVTERIILEMDKVSRAHEARFAVVLLHVFNKAAYIAFLRQSDVAHIDCAYDIKDDMRVPGEGHPNGEMHSLWARCVSLTLERDLPMDRPMSSSK